MSGNRMINNAVNDDVDPTDGRNESLNERMDRNWNEMMQELRVTQTGVQIFTGLLLTIAFQQRFGQLTTFQLRVYLDFDKAHAALSPFGCSRGRFTRLGRQEAATIFR